jgi:hypothetical protein
VEKEVRAQVVRKGLTMPKPSWKKTYFNFTTGSHLFIKGFPNGDVRVSVECIDLREIFLIFPRDIKTLVETLQRHLADTEQAEGKGENSKTIEYLTKRINEKPESTFLVIEEILVKLNEAVKSMEQRIKQLEAHNAKEKTQ